MTDLAHIPHRDGQTYDHGRDARRLAGQHARVFALMKDGTYRTLAEIAEATKDPEASISARLRDFRKPRFKAIYGDYTLERKHIRDGLWAYSLRRNWTDLFD